MISIQRQTYAHPMHETVSTLPMEDSRIFLWDREDSGYTVYKQGWFSSSRRKETYLAYEVTFQALTVESMGQDWK